MPTHTSFILSAVMSVNNSAAGVSGLCYGFSIQNRHRAPLITFSYATQDEADAARSALDDVLKKVIAVSTPG